MATTNYNPGAEKLQATAAPNLQAERARMDPAGSVDALTAALGMNSVRQELDAFGQRQDADKLQQQQAKFDWYVEQFRTDQSSGAVSQAQVKARFPETVPIIASRIAEAIGSQQGAKDFQGVIDDIAGNDSLRLDSTARAAYIAKRRAEIVGSIPAGNDFYGSGVVSSMDKLVRQHEANWQTETAQYHTKVQGEAFVSEAVDALNGGDPNALLAVDAKYKGSSSLNDLERNKLVVNAAIDLAHTNSDANVLKNVPQRFLNADSKAAFEKTRIQLRDKNITDFRNAEYLKGVQRETELRDGRVSIVQMAAAGKPVDPAKFRNNAELYQFALQMREAPRVDESVSAGNAQSIRNYILTQATIGDAGTPQQLIDKVASNPNLNPKERQKLIEEIPKLVEGRGLMSDDMVRQPLQDFLRPALDVLGKSTNSTIQSLIQGRNLEMQVTRGYDRDIEQGFRAHYEETGNWPTGNAKRLIVREATDRAEARLEKLTKIGSTNDKPAAAAAPARAPAITNNPATARPTPSASKALPAGVVKLD